MDRYFYSIEEDNRKKCVHFSGNVFCDEGNSYGTLAEWIFLYIPISECVSLIEKGSLFDWIDECISSVEELTEKECQDCINEYWNGKSGKKLPLNEITDKTECGYYYFDRCYT
jgi:hypothetical protein